jgi:hypothetical protein
MELKPQSSREKATTSISARILIAYIPSTKETQLLYGEDAKVEHLF